VGLGFESPTSHQKGRHAFGVSSFLVSFPCRGFEQDDGGFLRRHLESAINKKKARRTARFSFAFIQRLLKQSLQ
jgi:hypothetical protein